MRAHWLKSEHHENNLGLLAGLSGFQGSTQKQRFLEGKHESVDREDATWQHYAERNILISMLMTAGFPHIPEIRKAGDHWDPIIMEESV